MFIDQAGKTVNCLIIGVYYIHTCKVIIYGIRILKGKTNPKIAEYLHWCMIHIAGKLHARTVVPFVLASTTSNKR